VDAAVLAKDSCNIFFCFFVHINILTRNRLH
jgi:hypothetical protein